MYIHILHGENNTNLERTLSHWIVMGSLHRQSNNQNEYKFQSINPIVYNRERAQLAYIKKWHIQVSKENLVHMF